MLIDIGTEVVLRHNGRNYRPDDRLPNRKRAGDIDPAGLDPDLYRRFIESPLRRSRGMPRKAEKSVTVGVRVPGSVKRMLRAKARNEGKSLCAFTGEVLIAVARNER